MRGSSEEVVGGGKQVELGSYQFIVDTCEEKEITAKRDGVDVQIPLWSLQVTVLAGTVPGQEQKEMRYQDLFIKKVALLAAATGLTDKVTGQPFSKARLEEIEAANKAGEKIEFEFDPEEVLGRTFYADVVMGKPKTGGKSIGKSFPELGWKIVSVLDESVASDAEFPKDPIIMAQLRGGGETVGAGAGAASGGGKAASRFGNID